MHLSKDLSCIVPHCSSSAGRRGLCWQVTKTYCLEESSADCFSFLLSDLFSDVGSSASFKLSSLFSVSDSPESLGTSCSCQVNRMISYIFKRKCSKYLRSRLCFPPQDKLVIWWYQLPTIQSSFKNIKSSRFPIDFKNQRDFYI